MSLARGPAADAYRRAGVAQWERCEVARGDGATHPADPLPLDDDATPVYSVPSEVD